MAGQGRTSTYLLAKDVPACLADGSVSAGSPSASLKRMFERDKLELREQGVPIESIGEDNSDEAAYQLRTKDFYPRTWASCRRAALTVPPQWVRGQHKVRVRYRSVAPRRPPPGSSVLTRSRMRMGAADARL